MIIFYGEGRLGNQLFQYHALTRIASTKEQIVAVGLEDLEKSITLVGAPLFVIRLSLTLKRLVKFLLLPLVIRPLSRTLRLINYATETSYKTAAGIGAGGEIEIRAGLFRRVTFVDGGYYQNASHWPTVFPASTVRVNARLRQAARDYLHGIEEIQRRPAFVHIRRGDYLGYSNYGLHDLALPIEFYHRAIDELVRRLGSVHLLFVTDDPAWAEQHFGHIENKTITSSTTELDFAIMTECGSGIVSNSTFSLAAAFMLDKPDLVIAPRYWFGFRVAEWLPPLIKIDHDRVAYLPVISESFPG
jgi:hypothetical protein